MLQPEEAQHHVVRFFRTIAQGTGVVQNTCPSARVKQLIKLCSRSNEPYPRSSIVKGLKSTVSHSRVTSAHTRRDKRAPAGSGQLPLPHRTNFNAMHAAMRQIPVHALAARPKRRRRNSAGLASTSTSSSSAIQSCGHAASVWVRRRCSEATPRAVNPGSEMCVFFFTMSVRENSERDSRMHAWQQHGA